MTLDDLKGKKFGRLTVLYLAKRDKWRHIYWLCKCECGKETIVMADSLKSGKTTSCGCYAKEQASINSKKHGLSRSRINRIYHNMKQRCYNPTNKDFKDYGARGISICKEWLDDFMNFYDWAMANGYTDELTIDRINNNGNYEPKNCHWTTLKKQARNMRTNRLITFNDETHCISEWAEILNINERFLRTKLYRNNYDLKKVM